MAKPQLIKKPAAAIVGRVNVGKSTLFNRLIEEAKALVSPTPGTTRSPNYGTAIWRGRIFDVIDTGGLERRSKGELTKAISEYALNAARDADVILFLIDLKVGILPEDRALAKELKKLGKSIVLAGNKADSRVQKPKAEGLGLGELQIISATTGRGVGDLLDRAFDEFEKIKKEPPTIEEGLEPVKVTILGKPNVGKSSLLNALVGAPRAVVSEIAHTTREPQDTLVRLDDVLYFFVDTAGVRKKMKRAPELEAEGVRKTLKALKRAEIALFVLDPIEGIGLQDRHLAGLIKEKPIGVIMVANKWDLIKDKETYTQNIMKKEIARSLPFLTWAPIIFVSAKTGQHVKKIFSLIEEVKEKREKRISVKTLDSFMRKAMAKHPSRGKGEFPYLYGLKQTDINPPTFMISMRGRREAVHPSFLRFLENRLREEFDFQGTAVIVRAKTVKPR